LLGRTLCFSYTKPLAKGVKIPLNFPWNPHPNCHLSWKPAAITPGAVGGKHFGDVLVEPTTTQGFPTFSAIIHQMIRLSVNVNKIALLRNSRDIGIPNLLKAVETAVLAGAQGITVHPRPDQRHIRPSDVREIAALLAGWPGVEFNVEGYPFPEFIELVRSIRPHQCTLVPDSPGQTTSDHGWDLREDGDRISPIIQELHDIGCRVSLFMDADIAQIRRVSAVGADCIELYTQPYAAAFAAGDTEPVWKEFAAAAAAGRHLGLAVNAGHDLNLQNLARFCQIPGLVEVSIGHALIADALDVGLSNAVGAYLKILAAAPPI
jgi:pyridoxine 5-phosphate synthase